MPSPWLQIPNLVSLSRIAMVPFLGYYLARGDDRSTLICAILMIVAGITDGLDGYLARRLGQISKLGIALDPVADKIFAGALVLLLIFYRDFPIWLAAVSGPSRCRRQSSIRRWKSQLPNRWPWFPGTTRVHPARLQRLRRPYHTVAGVGATVPQAKRPRRPDRDSPPAC